MLIRHVGPAAGYRATHYTKNACGDIETLAGRRADGEAWLMTARAAIAGIEAGLLHVMVGGDGGLRRTVVHTDAAGMQYLREGDRFVAALS
jgi:hypothetical protein